MIQITNSSGLVLYSRVSGKCFRVIQCCK